MKPKLIEKQGECFAKDYSYYKSYHFQTNKINM